MVGDRRGRAALACVWLALQACASGYAPEFAEPQDVLPGRPAPPSGGSGSAGSGPTPSNEPYMGESCRMGESGACTCEAGGMGTRTCRFDVRSPTQGTFSACMSCSDPGAAGSGPGGTGGGGGTSGSGGTGGSGGTSGSGGTGGTGGAGGTGGSGAGTAGSGTGTGGTSGGTPPPGRPGWCAFVPVPIPGVCS